MAFLEKSPWAFGGCIRPSVSRFFFAWYRPGSGSEPLLDGLRVITDRTIADQDMRGQVVGCLATQAFNR